MVPALGHERQDPAEVLRTWPTEATGVAILCGRASGIVVADADGGAGSEASRWLGANAAPGAGQAWWGRGGGASSDGSCGRNSLKSALH